LTENEIAAIVVDVAYKIHVKLGPGVFESVYEAVMTRALTKRGLEVKRQYPIPVSYDGEEFDEGFRADLIIENKVIIELKSQETVLPVHKKQLLTYLRLSGLRLGLLINFGQEYIKNGIHRVVNGLPDESSSS